MFMCTVEFGTMPEILLTISGILAIIFFVSIGLLFVYIIVILINTRDEYSDNKPNVIIASLLMLIIALSGIFLKTSEDYEYEQSCENVKVAIRENYKNVDTISDISKKDLKGSFYLKDSDGTYRFRVEDNVLHIYCIEDDTKNKDIPGEIYWL